MNEGSGRPIERMHSIDWELEKNEDKRPEEWKSLLDNLQDAWDTLSSLGDAPLQEAEEGTAD